jgi:hypothetical protein
LVIRDKDKPMAARVVSVASLVPVIFALSGALGTDIYLASTQWILIAVLLLGWANYLLLEANYRLKH